MRKPIVWVVKEQVMRTQTGSEVMDYTPAYAYGEVRFITETDLPLHPKSSVARTWMTDVAKFLREFDAEKDFIILTGHTLAIYVLGLVTAGQGRTPPKILVWRREQGKYVVFDPVDVVEAAVAPPFVI